MRAITAMQFKHLMIRHCQHLGLKTQAECGQHYGMSQTQFRNVVTLKSETLKGGGNALMRPPTVRMKEDLGVVDYKRNKTWALVNNEITEKVTDVFFMSE